MTRLRLFKISPVPATDTKPSRVRITDMHNGTCEIISYTARGASDSVGRGVEYLQERGFNLVADSFDSKNNHYLISDTWGLSLKGGMI